MSRISSKIDALNLLRFEPLTSKVIAAIKVTMVDNTVIVLGSSGEIYTNAVAAHICYQSGHDGKLSRLLDGCVKLGVLTAKAVREHKAESKARYERYSRKSAAKSILDLSAEAGLNLTAKQRQLLEETAGVKTIGAAQ